MNNKKINITYLETQIYNNNSIPLYIILLKSTIRINQWVNKLYLTRRPKLIPQLSGDMLVGVIVACCITRQSYLGKT